ncbi:MAG: NAD(P)-binding domain-containing protein [Aerococcus sp.]|nr:NAD(P)-binding domain-containing protein [Aerococcus sp.]
MQIGILEPLNVPDEQLKPLIEPLEKAGHTVTVYDDRTTDPDELFERSKDKDIVVIANTPYPAEVIERLDQTKYINVAFTGVDHVGMDAANKKGITVSNAAGYAGRSVPELAIGLTLALYRNIPGSNEDARKSDDFPGAFKGREIAGKTVGIVGTGKLGIEAAKLFKAFGAELIGYNRSEKDAAKEIGLVYKDLDDVMAESDIISIHLPSTPDTKKSIDAEKIGKMKESAILINTARGAIVDNEALAQALNDGKIAGAGIDVFDVEPPLPADTALLHAKNAILTPHLGFLTEESMVKRAKIVFDNIDKFIDGNPQNVMK